jgi:CHASE3 domain sensor protein
MHSRAARLALLFLFLIALSTATYLFWKGESVAAAQSADARRFDESTRVVEHALLDMRAAQRAYVAAGQSGDVWVQKVAAGVHKIREASTELRGAATTTQAQTSFDEVRSTIDDFVKVDRRAVEYVKRDQRPLASDVIFADGVELTDAALAALARGREAELVARGDVVAEAGRRSLFAIAAGAAAAMLAVLLLLPSRASAPGPASAVADPGFTADRAGLSLRSSAAAPASGREADTLRPATSAAELVEAVEPGSLSDDIPVVAEPVQADASAPAGPAEDFREAAAVPVEAIDPPDFAGLASLCNDLARVVDTRALPSLLDRAAVVLDASGIILWIADPDGRELNPIFAQGYPQQLVNRLGTIPRDAENATAAAFRTSLLQTVMADQISPGAIAAPLVTSGGCVGVMAAEVRHDGERQDGMLAAATIVAAQLATLVGPPAARSSSRAAGG